MIEGKKIKLRALEPEDLDFLYRVENDTDFWEVSHTQTPYSRFVLKQYLDNALRDIYETRQLRLAIAEKKGDTIGLIDLFDFDPKNKRAGLGIVIAVPENRGKGYATEALQLLCRYAFSHLGLHQVYADVHAGNQASVALFEKCGFEKSGLKKDWNCHNGSFQDVWLYQKINHVP